MKKLFVSTLAAAALLAAAASANAYVLVPGPPVIVPTCIWGVFGPVCY